MCEDYRASASLDLKIDAADIKAGKKIQCPLQVLWAAQNRVDGKIYDVLSIWKDEGVNVTGKGLPGSHSCRKALPKKRSPSSSFLERLGSTRSFARKSAERRARDL